MNPHNIKIFLLKVTKFLVEISHFKFLFMTEKKDVCLYIFFCH